MTLAHETSADPSAPAILQEAVAAFEAELSELLKTKRGQWVAYHGPNRLAFSTDKTTLCRQLLRLGRKWGSKR